MNASGKGVCSGRMVRGEPAAQDTFHSARTGGLIASPNLFQALYRRALARPEAVAHVVVDGPTLTFGAWHAQACNMTTFNLRPEMGFRANIGLKFESRFLVEAAVTMTAVQLFDAVPVFLPASLDERGLARYRKDLLLDAVLPDDGLLTKPGGGRPCAGTDCRLIGRAECDKLCERVAAVVLSSGTTGHPKAVAITHQDLAFSVRDGWSEEVLLTASATHTVDGAMHLVAPLLDGRKVVTLPRFHAASFWNAVEEHEPTYLKLVPAMARLIQAVSTNLPASRRAVRKIRMGSAAVKDEDVEALSELFPSAEIWMDYSSTESGKAGVSVRLDRNDNDRSPWRGELGVPNSDTFVRVVDQKGLSTPSGTSGEIQLRHAVLPRRQYFPDDRAFGGLATDECWVPMGDFGVLDDAGRLWYRGRLADIANCGGENVSLIEVEEAFLECESIKDAAAAALPHPVMGETVGILLVPAGGNPAADADMDAFVRSKLPAAKRPTRLLWASEVPRSEHGKIARWRVRDALLNAPMRSAVEHSSTITILDLVRAQGFTEATADDNLFELGLTSVDLLQLAMDIEGELGITVGLGLLLSASTIVDLERLLDAKGER